MDKPRSHAWSADGEGKCIIGLAQFASVWNRAASPALLSRLTSSAAEDFPMTSDPKTRDPQPRTIAPKKPMPGQDEHFPGQPSPVYTEDEEDIDRGEPGHVESAKQIERKSPSERR
jgi:hypothetical protein